MYGNLLICIRREVFRSVPGIIGAIFVFSVANQLSNTDTALDFHFLHLFMYQFLDFHRAFYVF